jgi:outer membrane protein OmpA-like peptidoglycan-associated protein
MIAKYMKNHPEANLKVQGYASPEGSAELNQKLSEQRAEVVKNALIKKYKIAASRITTEGLGATDKLSDEVDFNRVAMFIDTTKQ